MLYAVIMAGGVGERFWPRSRKSTPKQLLNLSGQDKTLLQETCERLSPLIEKENIFIVTNKEQRDSVVENIRDIPRDQIIGEPCGRNTAACIGLAAVLIKNKDPEASMLVLPADHMIPDKENFHKTIEIGLQAVNQGKLVTLGITPTRPETEYGYIEEGEKFIHDKIFQVKQFKEKPDIKTAESFLEKGCFLWNSGMFVWKVNAILKEIKKYMPDLYQGLEKIKSKIGVQEQESIIKDVYEGLEKISIDYGVLEKSQDVVVVKSDFVWDDLGLWTAMDRIYPKDENNNVCISGDKLFLDSKENILFTDEGVIGVIGLENIVVVRDRDAVLVCAKDKAKDVKALVAQLKERYK